MSLADDSSLEMWTFGSSTFACEISGNKWQGWFEAAAILSVSAVLDSNKRYVDIGGVNFGNLSREIAFDDEASRDSFLSLVGQVKTLSNSAGRSISACLSTAVYINADGPYYRANASWEAL